MNAAKQGIVLNKENSTLVPLLLARQEDSDEDGSTTTNTGLFPQVKFGCVEDGHFNAIVIL